MNFKDIKIKLLFWYSLTIFLILVSFSFILMYLSYKQNIEIVDTKLIAVINDINHDLEERNNLDFSDSFDEEEEFLIKNLYISIYKKKEKFVVLYTNSNKNSKNLKELDRGQKDKFSLGNEFIDSLRVIRLHSSKIDENIYIEAATSLKDKIKEPLENLRNTLLVLIPLIFIISILMAYLIIKNALKPVKKVIDEVASMHGDDFSKRLKKLNSNDEIEELILSFNKMLTKVEESVEKIKRFSNDVSHELKTPLTVIRGELELGLRKERSFDEYKEILKNSLEETKQLQDLIDNLLFLSNSNSKEIQKRFELTSIDELLFDVILENQNLAKKVNIKIECKEIEELNIKANKLLIKILISNLLKNAIKYSNENSKIIIKLNKDRLLIKDFGIGIEKKDIKYIFDRFYRVDAARTRGGYGLGLSIVKNITQLHSFKILVNSEIDKYSEFIIEF